MHNVGMIWQYVDRPMTTIETRTCRHYPLLGRHIELMIVTAQIVLLNEPTTIDNERRHLAAIIFQGKSYTNETISMEYAYSVDFSYILGDDKVGRTRLLQYIADSFVNSTCIRIIHVQCQLEQRFNQLYLLRLLLKELLNLPLDEREQYLLDLFDDRSADDRYLQMHLFLFNDLFDVAFDQQQDTTDHNVVHTYQTILDRLLIHILQRLFPSTKYDRIQLTMFIDEY
jgi:hypothetical protein